VYPLHRRYGFIVVVIVLLSLMCLWIARFGVNVPSPEGVMPLLREDAWVLVSLGLIATTSALLSLFLEFKLSRSAAFIGWVLYFPVLFNTLVPMFILFFSVLGVVYAPWLVFTELAFANRLINGIIRLPDENVALVVEGLGYVAIVVGIAIYSLSLYQLLAHARKERALLTRGLYSVTRHPQYLGLFLWTMGFAVSGWRLINYLMWLTLCYAYLFLAEYEEMELEKTFGKAYVQYKSRVSFIIPYLKLDRILSKTASGRKTRLLTFTVFYVLLLIFCYYIIDPYIVLYR
jgi:protein-S-isoprenylcysteine O-methyltransferase Ste14